MTPMTPMVVACVGDGERGLRAAGYEPEPDPDPDPDPEPCLHRNHRYSSAQLRPLAVVPVPSAAELRALDIDSAASVAPVCCFDTCLPSGWNGAMR